MVRSIYMLAIFMQVVFLVTAQEDYCATQCQDLPADGSVVCTCVLCPEHTCEEGLKECAENNTKCTTIGLDEEQIITKVCPISTHCIKDDPLCPCPKEGCDEICHACLEGQEELTPNCMICCPGTESLDGCEVPNVCFLQSFFGEGKDGTPCEPFCPTECTEEVCCSNYDDNDCPLPPGKLVPPTEPENPECDKKFCPCKCADPLTGECCPAPVDDNGCQMEKRKCVDKALNPETGALCPSVICPEACDETANVLEEACEACIYFDNKKCCPKVKDDNGIFCPPDYDHNCGSSCGCDCESSGGMCCEGCVEKKGDSPGCKPKGKCIPADEIPKDILGEKCPNESVCDCCCNENEECCPQGKGPDGCEKKSKCEPPMKEGCKAVCPCVDGVTCPGTQCCPGHVEHGCEGPPVCKKCGTKTAGDCKGEPCHCFCPASCKLPEQIACEVQIDCDGCPLEQVCRDKVKNVNGKYCEDDSASHGCPITCNEKDGECECIPPEDILGCRGPATCVQRKKDNNGGFCPFESACPRHCTDGAAKDCGLDTSGCPVWRCGSCDTEATVDEVVVPPEAPAGPPPEAPAEGPAETPAEGPAETPAETPAEEPAPLPPAEAPAE